jgi:hypothetical protein
VTDADQGKQARQAKAAAFQADLARTDRNRRMLLAGGVVALVAVIALAVFLSTRGSSSSTPPAASGSSTGSGSAADQILPAPVTGTAVTTQAVPSKVTAPDVGIDGLLAWDTAGYPGPGAPGPGTLAHDHVDGPVQYAVVPPVGGQHSPIWVNAGVYTAPITTERGVHVLEHGGVWITYATTLPADQIATLTALVAKQSLIAEAGEGSPGGQANRFVLMSPWATADLPAPIVISSWGYQVQVQTPDDPRLQKFIDTFRVSKTYSPEFGSPVDGVPVETGGRAASNGGAVPNPPGKAA